MKIGMQIEKVDRIDACVCVFAWFLSAVMFFSAAQHLKNPYGFLVSAIHYELLPALPLVFLVSLLPLAQVTATCCLILKPLRRTGLMIGAVLLASFAFAQIYALSNGLMIDCGCFGQAFEKPISFASAAIVVTCSVLSFVFATVHNRERQE